MMPKRLIVLAAMAGAFTGLPVLAAGSGDSTDRPRATATPYDAIRAAVPVSTSPLAIGRRAALDDQRPTPRSAGIASTRPAGQDAPPASPPAPR
ncbi:hypothetical protein [Microvirgula aerodenitrificans]|uniref:hypothetical protein n=1 Tax=Microvirgula aerodenitrificans TaxID=57480 RepID=UPI00248DFF5B|nr:hypothetical protein [Microvirgula aerodenitrificans]